MSELMKAAIPEAFVAFEEPSVKPMFPGRLANWERLFRRRYIETNELLGRGDVLRAFDAGDTASLSRYAELRLAWIDRQMTRRGVDTYIDISKHFLHGLHRPTLGFLRARGDWPVRVIRLVRDPIENMRSYLNRNKKISLDYGATNSSFNELQLDPNGLSKGELYLHAWCETYLRGDSLIQEFDLAPAETIATRDLSNPKAVEVLMDRLGLPHGAVPVLPAQNTNIERGFRTTEVDAHDVELFKRFMDKVPEDLRRRLPLPEGSINV
ncbi:MAG: hypothetical protein P1V34_09775 [Alphaproteobacteria bacterium]|nr:hypothetical protein [Alphaproteobacteria bacterium]